MPLNCHFTFVCKSVCVYFYEWEVCNERGEKNLVREKIKHKEWLIPVIFYEDDHTVPIVPSKEEKSITELIHVDAR